MSVYVRIYDPEKNVTHFDVSFFARYRSCPLRLVTSNNVKEEGPRHFVSCFWEYNRMQLELLAPDAKFFLPAP